MAANMALTQQLMMSQQQQQQQQSQVGILAKIL
jgi:hypothetical protein